MSLKEKIRVVLNQNGQFTCPIAAGSSLVDPTNAAAAPQPTTVPPTPKVDLYSVVLTDLSKRGASRPRRVEALKNTIRSAVKNAKGSIKEPQLEALFKRLEADGKVTIEGTRVSYSL